MGNDLIGACLFCAGLLLGIDLAPPPGWNAEVGTAYSAIGRRVDLSGGRDDVSRTIGRFGLVGFGANRPARNGLGAGTPELEWKLRVALAPSRSAQAQSPSESGQTSASGDGRFENFEVLLRWPLGPRDSVELTESRKSHDSTEVLRTTAADSVFGGERTLGADRIDAALGWRHRWRGLEASASVVYVQADGSDGAAGAFHISGDGVWGAGLETRALFRNWTLVLGGQRASGSVPVSEENAPAFQVRRFSANSTTEAYRLGVGWAGKRTSFFVSGTYDRSALPFVALAVLGTEAVAFEHGYHPSSQARHRIADLIVRESLAPSVSARIFARWARGDETLILSDSSGLLPSQRLEIRRSAGFLGAAGAGDITIGLAAEISMRGF